MGLRGKNLVDLGAGEGRVLASAMKCGANSVVGYELPANSAHKYVYDAVLHRIFAGIIHVNVVTSSAQWLAQDIDQVFLHRILLTILKLIIFIQSGYWTSRQNGHRLFILEWYALFDPSSRSQTFSQLPNSPHTRRFSRRQMEFAR